jgi:TnpA family transposase
MSRRAVLTNRQRASLFDLPTDEATLLRHYILTDEDLAHVRRRRRPQNRMGFALQLCALRYPGRLLQPGETIPERMLAFIGAQLGLSGEALIDYGAREATRYQHSAALQRLYGYRPFEGRVRDEVRDWLIGAAETARSNDVLAAAMLEELRTRKIIVPGPSTIERLCANALVAAERAIASRIAARLDPALRSRLLSLLADIVDPTGVTRFVWLRNHEPGANSNAVNHLLDQLDWVRKIGVLETVLDGTPAHRVTRLRRQGERYYADGLRDLPEDRRLAILAVCVIEWRASIADAVIETHDRIVGKTYRAAERRCAAVIADQRASVQATLEGFAKVGASMLEARRSAEPIDATVELVLGWDGFARLVSDAAALTDAISADPLDFVGDGYARFRRYAPRLLTALDLKGGRAAGPVLEAITALRELNAAGNTGAPPLPADFVRHKWRKRVIREGRIDRRLWETALLFALRDGLRSGDLWIEESRRHQAFSTALAPMTAVAGPARLAVPLNPAEWIASRKAALAEAIQRVGETARKGKLPNGVIENGALRLEKLERVEPEGAETLVLDLYRRMPAVRITDILMQTDDAIGFTETFTDLRTGAACRDRIGLLSVILADGINLGLKKMAAATGAHSLWELIRIARWHVEEDAYRRALAMVVEAQAGLPMARVWGAGDTASSDGQFFSVGGPGEAMNLVNAKYGTEPGIKAYSHVSDQFAPFAVQTIPATASEALYILDGLLMNDAGRRVREHYADTGGFTDHVFALCAILGFTFAPRIRDLPSKRLYAFDPAATHATLRPMVAARIKTERIARNWPDILRIAASAAAGTLAPSQLLKKLSAYSPQNELVLALREVGRVERTLFILRWITDPALQRRAQAGLNKGEAHHALKRAISLGRRGEISDRTSEGQHYRMAGLNLLAGIIIHWNTARLGEIVADLTASGDPPDPELLAHVSPLGWEHINLTGEYRWAS